jgi:hypothetical protein
MKRLIALVCIFLSSLSLPVIAQNSQNLQPGTEPQGFPFSPNSITGLASDTTSTFFLLNSTGTVQNNYRTLSLTSPLTGTDNGAKNTYVISVGPVLAYISGLSISSQQTFANTVLGFSGVSAGDMTYFNGTNWVRLPIGSNGNVLAVVSGIPSWQAGGGGGGAPTTSTYITTANETGSLPNSSQLSATAPVVLTNGVNTSTLSLNNTVILTTGAQTITGQKTIAAPIISSSQTTGLALKGSSFTDTLLITDPVANRSLTIPDPGASASFVLTAGTQTLGGTYTVTNPLTLSSNTVMSSTGNTITVPNLTDTLVNLTSTQTLQNKTINGLMITSSPYKLLGSNNFNFTWSSPSATRTYNWADVGTNGDVAMNATGTSYAQGSIVYGNGSVYTTLAPGGMGEVLTMGSSNTPMWGTASVPYGTVVAWWATDSSIPTGWALCNGQTTTWQTGPHAGSSITLPNLIGMFIQGSDITGGSSSANGNGFGSQTNQSQVGAATHTHAVNIPSGTNNINQGIISAATGLGINVAASGHNHQVTGDTAATNTQPPAYAMVYLMKL